MQGFLAPHRTLKLNCRHRPLLGRHSCARHSIIAPRAQATPFHEVKQTAQEAYSRAQELLPALERARTTAENAREPAAEAERLWQESYSRLAEVQEQAHALQDELRSLAGPALGGNTAVADAMLRHHATNRLESFRGNLSNVALWQPLVPTLQPLHWLPGCTMLTQCSAVVSEEVPYLVGCIALTMPVLNDDLWNVSLHWSLAANSHAPWANKIPAGWHTSPAVSHPRGSTAWETPLGVQAPVINNDLITAATVHSVIVQIPMEGSLKERGGIKFVLRRADGGTPDWIKPGDHSDFWLDFAPAIDVFQSLLQSGRAEEVSDGGIDEGNRSTVFEGTDTDNTITTMRSTESSTSLNEAADGVDEWISWAFALSLQQEAIAADAAADAAAEIGPQLPSLEDIQEMLVPPTGWVTAIQTWEALPDSPPRQPASLSRQVQQLRSILLAAQQSTTSTPAEDTTDENSTKELTAKLLSRCEEVDYRFLQNYDAAALAARHAQQERERLWEEHTNAADEAARLQTEALAATETARRSVGALRGRPAEVTKDELVALAAHVAGADERSTTLWGGLWPFGSGRQMVFVKQEVFSMGGLDGNVVIQVYLEGESEAVKAAVEAFEKSEAERENSEDESTSVTSGERLAASVLGAGGGGGVVDSGSDGDDQQQSNKPAFDSAIITIAAGESFPDSGLRAPVHLHVGSVAHQHAKWMPLPSGWRSEPALETGGDDANNDSNENDTQGDGADLPWVPMQTFAMTRPDGSPAAVDPIVHATCLHLPMGSSTRAVELVLKTADGRWVNRAEGGNFYVELPTAVASYLP